MNRLVENTEALSLAASMARSGKEPHSIMICGERGSGKKTLAKAIASLLLCEEGCGVGCGKCRACRLIQKDAHTDVVTLSASETGNYKVEDVRALAADTSSTPNEGRFRVFIIPDLDASVQTLTQIQNCLLKVIEEPPDHAVIILTARSKELFLDTIISRTLQFYTQEVSRSAAVAYLMQNGADRLSAEESYSRCGGNIGRCEEYISNDKIREQAQTALDFMTAVADRDEFNALRILTAADMKRAEFVSLMGFMQRIVRDSCRIRIGKPVSLPFSAQLCKKLSQTCSAAKLTDIYDILCVFSQRADSNCLIQPLVNALTAQLFR